MTLYAGVNASVMSALRAEPRLRRVLWPASAEAVIDRLAEACAEGAQAYWVCPSIDSEDGQLVSATFTHQHLSKRLADHSVGPVHGR